MWNTKDTGNLCCPNCGNLMKPMKTKNKYKCSVCKTKLEQFTIFNFDKPKKEGKFERK